MFVSSRECRRRFLAFSLVEVVISVGIVSFAVLMLMALLPMGLQSSRLSAAETGAASLLGAVEADLLWATSVASPRFAITPSPATVSASGETTNWLTVGGFTNRTSATYGLRINYQVQPGGTTNCAVGADLLIWWPAQAPIERAAGTLESYVVFPRTNLLHEAMR